MTIKQAQRQAANMEHEQTCTLASELANYRRPEATAAEKILAWELEQILLRRIAEARAALEHREWIPSAEELAA